MYGKRTHRTRRRSQDGFRCPHEEDPEKLAEFEARIARGEKIEPDDWMPAEYRRQVLRMIEQHAHSEIIGALPEGTWITRAPTLQAASSRSSQKCRMKSGTGTCFTAQRKLSANLARQ